MTRPASSPRPLLVPGYRRILHGGDYNPDQWLGEPAVIEDDFRLMKLSGCNTFAVGIFAWTSYEPEEGKYDFGWLDRILDRMAEAGNRVALATPSGAKPAWMAKKYPEVRRVNREGRREPQQGRHNHCWQSPVYREKVRAMNERLAERYGKHPALGMWHISNEYSGECYCDLCLARWHGWLEEKYGTVEALNDAWWTAFWSHTFTRFDEIDPRDGSIDGLKLDFFRFGTDQVIDFMGWEIAALRKHSDVACTTNLMGTFPWMDYSRLVESLDFVADDQYPAYAPDQPGLARSAANVSFKDDLHRCFKPDRPWMLMESCPEGPQWNHPVRLKRPGLHQAEMLQALGHGAEGTCYFQWRKGRGGSEKLHGAVVDHVGHEDTRTFRMLADLSTKYEKLEPILGSVVQSEVAVLYDWEVRRAFETTDGVRNVESSYQQTCVDHYDALSTHGVSVDVIASDRDFSGYKLLVAPQLWLLKPGVAKRIADFVATGGTFVTTYYSGAADSYNRCLRGGWPGEGLMDVLGIWNEETDWLPEGATRRVVTTEAASEVDLLGELVGDHVCALVHSRGAKVLAAYDEDFFAGTPALTVNHHGSGAAYYQGTHLGAGPLKRFYGALVARLDVPCAVAQELPAGVRLQRRHGPEQEFFFLQNFSGQAREIGLRGDGYVDLLTSSSVPPRFELPPWGSTVLARSRG